MNPSPGMGYAKRKPLIGNPYEWFDEEAEAVRPLLYSTNDRGGLCIHYQYSNSEYQLCCQKWGTDKTTGIKMEIKGVDKLSIFILLYELNFVVLILLNIRKFSF
jgi:hypothetical protein